MGSGRVPVYSTRPSILTTLFILFVGLISLLGAIESLLITGEELFYGVFLAGVAAVSIYLVVHDVVSGTLAWLTGRRLRDLLRLEGGKIILARPVKLEPGRLLMGSIRVYSAGRVPVREKMEVVRYRRGPGSPFTASELDPESVPPVDGVLPGDYAYKGSHAFPVEIPAFKILDLARLGVYPLIVVARIEAPPLMPEVDRLEVGDSRARATLTLAPDPRGGVRGTLTFTGEAIGAKVEVRVERGGAKVDATIARLTGPGSVEIRWPRMVGEARLAALSVHESFSVKKFMRFLGLEAGDASGSVFWEGRVELVLVLERRLARDLKKVTALRPLRG